jgi:prepilin-type N-terminal cleavage/methylation domain-containing protein
MRTRHSQRGVTLIELLVALALLGFVLLGITPLFMASVKSNYSGNEYTSINMLARDRLEQLMNLPFNDGQLAPGIHGNDLPATLPDPNTGLPPASGGVRNPFSVCYQVFQYQIPTVVATNAPFTPIPITDANLTFHYRRIEVTVESSTGPIGIGTRKARVSGVLSNPFPETNLSGTDPGGSCP